MSASIASARPSDGALRLGAFVPATRAQGPWLRAAAWVAGCTLACPGCSNPELWPAEAGSTVPIAELAAALAKARAALGIEGLTVLGGEPLEQLAGVQALCAAAQRAGLGVIVFTGLRWAQARARPGFEALWRAIDTLVDGPYVAAQRATGRHPVGSANQRLWHRTSRYSDPWLWTGPIAELRLPVTGPATLIGAPALTARIAASVRGPVPADPSARRASPALGSGAPPPRIRAE